MLGFVLLKASKIFIKEGTARLRLERHFSNAERYTYGTHGGGTGAGVKPLHALSSFRSPAVPHGRE